MGVMSYGYMHGVHEVGSYRARKGDHGA